MSLNYQSVSYKFHGFYVPSQSSVSTALRSNAYKWVLRDWTRLLENNVKKSFRDLGQDATSAAYLSCPPRHDYQEFKVVSINLKGLSKHDNKTVNVDLKIINTTFYACPRATTQDGFLAVYKICPRNHPKWYHLRPSDIIQSTPEKEGRYFPFLR